jgi:hypothetical protein
MLLYMLWFMPSSEFQMFFEAVISKSSLTWNLFRIINLKPFHWFFAMKLPETRRSNPNSVENFLIQTDFVLSAEFPNVFSFSSLCSNDGLMVWRPTKRLDHLPAKILAKCRPKSFAHWSFHHDSNQDARRGQSNPSAELVRASSSTTSSRSG